MIENMKENKNMFITAGVLFGVFLLFTIMVAFIDVQPIGPEESMVGFAKLNGSIAESHPYDSFAYKLSEVLGFFAIFTVVVFGLFGAMQLYFRKSLAKVDKDLYALAGLYVGVLICYIIFEKLALNYRPVMIDEVLEASYPSSHTMLSVAFVSAAIQQFSMRLKNKQTRDIVIGLLLGDGLGIIISRYMAGVHWFTDIVGGIILAAAWFVLYWAVVKSIYLDRR